MTSRIVNYGSAHHTKWAIERMGLSGDSRERARLHAAAERQKKFPAPLPNNAYESAAPAKQAFDERHTLRTLTDAQRLFPNNMFLQSSILAHPEEMNSNVTKDYSNENQ